MLLYSIRFWPQRGGKGAALKLISHPKRRRLSACYLKKRQRSNKAENKTSPESQKSAEVVDSTPPDKKVLLLVGDIEELH